MMIRKFWWDQRGDQRVIHWKKWETLCQPNDEGSLGFKDLCKFNEAMLAQQGQRLIHDIDSLFYQVFKAKCLPNCLVFEAKVKSGSFSWKSILKAWKVILQGTKWHVGDGCDIKFFEDRWLPGKCGDRVISQNSSITYLYNRTSSN